MDINAFAQFRIVFDNTYTGYVIYNFTNLTPRVSSASLYPFCQAHQLVKSTFLNGTKEYSTWVWFVYIAGVIFTF